MNKALNWKAYIFILALFFLGAIGFLLYPVYLIHLFFTEYLTLTWVKTRYLHNPPTIGLNYYIYEDTFFETTNDKDYTNANRHKYISFEIFLVSRALLIDIKLNKVGNFYYGRDLRNKNIE